MNESTPPRVEPRLSRGEQEFAIKTWRYLRLAMVVLVAGLAISILTERSTSDCFETSISAYYYTSVHAYFIAALVTIGVCLFCLKGSTDGEDVLLNLAGMFAPVVGLVPTPGPAKCGLDSGTTQHIHDNVVNNMTALYVVGFLALAVMAVFRDKCLPSRAALLGYAGAVVSWIAGVVVLLVDDGFFVEKAHGAAAGLMFFWILLVVCFNARDYTGGEAARAVRNRYGVIAVCMLTSAVVIGGPKLLGVDHPIFGDRWLLALEVALIALFAVFWAIQTKDLWHAGLREERSRAPG